LIPFYTNIQNYPDIIQIFIEFNRDLIEISQKLHSWRVTSRDLRCVEILAPTMARPKLVPKKTQPIQESCRHTKHTSDKTSAKKQISTFIISK